jgi:hypothetical protein
LRRHGIARLPELLPAAAISDMLAWLAPREVIGPGGLRGPLAALPVGTAMAAYALESVLDCPHVLGVMNHPAVIDIAETYLGCRPTISSVGLRWSLPTPARATDVQHFHRDTDDWRFLKLFIYLTEVDAAAGPHLYVTGSHATAGRLRARPYTQAEIEQRYGPAAIQPVTGPAGTSFIADTYGIHAGAVPEARPRLILQVQYSVLPIFAFAYAPVRLPSAPPIDGYRHRLLVAS